MKRFMYLFAMIFFAASILSASLATPVSAQNNNGFYVGLGDSVAAGLGLTPAQDSGGSCGRSSQSYVYLVAQAKNMPFMHLACSGATAGDLVTQQGVSGPNPRAQLDAAFSRGTPQLITITAGANDMQWREFITKCATTDCGTATDSAATKALRAILQQKLQFAFADIQARSGATPPRVVITGYSNPVSNYCKGRQSLVSNSEINWLNKERDALNKTIRVSMKGYKFVRYASTDFTSHTICAKVPWSQGLNDPAPLHPNALGQEAIAKSVLRAAR